MKRRTRVFLGGAILWLGLTGTIGVAQRASGQTSQAPAKAIVPKVAPVSSQTPPSQDHNAVLRRYCVTCHNETRKTGGLSLATFDVARAAQDADVAERVIRKLQAGLMPPPTLPRPDEATNAALVAALETTVDAAAAAKPNPGVRTFQRLNRPEYARAVRDLFGLDVDVASYLPPDTVSQTPLTSGTPAFSISSQIKAERR